MSASSTYEPGTRIDHLVIEREIGTGAFGTVYLAKDTVIGRNVAVKVLKSPGRPLTEADRNRFRAEAQLIGKLNSSHIVTLHHVHNLPGGDLLLEMEYVDGGSLEDLLGDDLRLPVSTALRIAAGVLAGLTDAHESGVLHGDLKPGNVLIARDGTVKLADFGLAQVVADRTFEAVHENAVAGTPHYMAPEVILGEPPRLAADIWGVGVLLYRMVAGRVPFEGKDLGALFLAIQNATPPPLGPEVPGALASVIDCCLSKQPLDRPQSAAALASLVTEVSLAARATEPCAPAVADRALAGREREVARLNELLASVVAGKPAVVLVTGPPGVGKSTLLHAAATAGRRLGFRWVEAGVTATEGLLRPLLAGIRQALGDEGTDALPSLDPARYGSATPILRDLLGSHVTLELQGAQQMIWALQHLLRGLASDRPLGLVLEDVDRAQPSDVALLADLVRRLSGTRTFVAISARSGDASTSLRDSAPLAPLAGTEGTVHLEVGPLPDAAVLEILENHVEGSIDSRVAERIIRLAAGNPFFAVEMVRHFEQTEAARREDGVLCPGPQWDAAKPPRRLVDVLSARLGTLGAEDRELVDVAAVDGYEFDGQALSAVLQRPYLHVLRRLQGLYRDHSLVVARPRGYRFANPLVHEVIYDEVAPDLRRELHRSFAEHLESRTTSVDPERIGTHWEAAGETDRARPYLLRAALDAARRTEQVRAIDLAARAGLSGSGITPRAAQEHSELLLHLARFYANRAQPADVEAIYKALIEGTEASREPFLRLRVVARRAHYRYFARGLTLDEEQELRGAERLLPVCEELGRARYLLGVIAKFREDLPEATRWLRAADETFAALGAQDHNRASVLDQLGSVALRRGDLAAAHRLYGEAADASLRAGRVVNAAVSEVNKALAAFEGGDVDGQEARLDQLFRTLSLERADNLAAHTLVLLAQVRCARGRMASAKTTVARAVAQSEKISYRPGLCAAKQLQGYIASIEGRLEEAKESLDAAKAVAEQGADLEARALSHVLEAKRLAFQGQQLPAKREALEALRLSRESKSARLPSHVVLHLVEAAPFGLAPDVWPIASKLLVDLEPSGGPTDGIARIVDGARAFRDPDAPPTALRGAAAELTSERIGDRRASLRALGGWFLAEALAREGRWQEGRVEATKAHDAADALGYVWLRQGLADWLTKRRTPESETERTRTG